MGGGEKGSRCLGGFAFAFSTCGFDLNFLSIFLVAFDGKMSVAGIEFFGNTKMRGSGGEDVAGERESGECWKLLSRGQKKNFTEKNLKKKRKNSNVINHSFLLSFFLFSCSGLTNL